jgi:RNA polymerase-binding transcription factor DksA
MTPLDKRRTELLARRATLSKRMEGIEQELDSHDERDWEELAVEREGDEVLEDLGHSAQTEIRMIDAALARMDEGEYGFCVTCGAEIDAARLDVVPATPFCRNCAPGAKRG